MNPAPQYLTQKRANKDPYNFIKEQNDPERLTVLGLEPRQSWEPTSQRWPKIFQKTCVFQPWLCCRVTVDKSPHTFGLQCLYVFSVGLE